MAQQKPILVLGAGINGAAVARELALNGLPTIVVDCRDIASGTTAYSSRLIHGGLRYLEYGELALVRESLHERRYWLRAAPHLVHPLRLFVPIGSRWGGLGQAIARLTGLPTGSERSRPRGLWVVRAGLALYDLVAGDPLLPRHTARRLDACEGPPVDPDRYRWVCSFYDAQVEFPERMVVEMLLDARRAAAERGVRFDVWTYHEARLHGARCVVAPAGGRGDGERLEFDPAAIVNATGAWVDATLRRLQVRSRRLIGGTKGSHLVTSHRELRQALQSGGIYAEAVDGRPFFILPFGSQTLIGTTDIPFDGSPEDAVASEGEVEYLIESTRRVLPHVDLQRADIDLHYAGVRPLPAGGAGQPASITRRHFLVEHRDTRVPMWSIVGGKLTTCRSLASQVAWRLLQQFGGRRRASSARRPLPGAERYPRDESERNVQLAQLSHACGLPLETVREAWRLCGSLAGEALDPHRDGDRAVLCDTKIPVRLVRQVIEREWVARLGDLVERRLMLLYQRGLSRRCLLQLAELMVEAGKLRREEVEDEVSACVERLRVRFGKRIVESSEI